MTLNLTPNLIRNPNSFNPIPAILLTTFLIVPGPLSIGALPAQGFIIPERAKSESVSQPESNKVKIGSEFCGFYRGDTPAELLKEGQDAINKLQDLLNRIENGESTFNSTKGPSSIRLHSAKAQIKTPQYFKENLKAILANLIIAQSRLKQESIEFENAAKVVVCTIPIPGFESFRLNPEYRRFDNTIDTSYLVRYAISNFTIKQLRDNGIEIPERIDQKNITLSSGVNLSTVEMRAIWEVLRNSNLIKRAEIDANKAFATMLPYLFKMDTLIQTSVTLERLIRRAEHSLLVYSNLSIPDRETKKPRSLFNPQNPVIKTSTPKRVI